VVTTTKQTNINADWVTKYDIASQKRIVAIIKKGFKKHNFLGEESLNEKNDSAFTWVIDPLDGTSNFSKGIPYFSVSIALKHFEETIIGVIALPIEGKIIYAEKGQGVFCNNKKISVSKTQKLKDAYVGIGLIRNKEGYIATNQNIASLAKHHTKFRIFGSIASDLAYTAMGSLDAVIIHNANPWDVQAGLFLVEEAGGKVNRGNKTTWAGNPAILKQIKKS
jgi:myo-inositol-1(or 4)-monophosphatase